MIKYDVTGEREFCGKLRKYLVLLSILVWYVYILKFLWKMCISKYYMINMCIYVNIYLAFYASYRFICDKYKDLCYNHHNHKYVYTCKYLFDVLCIL